MMTFTEAMAQTPTMYDGLPIDEGTQSALLDWYGFREVCDDDKFVTFYRRKLSIVADQYNGLLRVQKTQFDPMVSNYVERLIEHAANSTRTTSGDTTVTRGTGSTVTSTRTPDLTTTDKRTAGGTDTTSREDGGSDTRTASQSIDEKTATASDTTDTTTRNNSSTENGSSTDKTAEAQKNNPQSISYAGATAGSLPGLDWSYMSGQRQNESEGTTQRQITGNDTTETTHSGAARDNYTERTGTNSNTDTTTYGKTGTDTTTYGRTDDTTTKTTGTDKTETTTTQNGSDKTATTGTDATETGGTDKVRETGRGGILPQEALEKARDYIMGTNAFLWLIGQLDPCFFGLYDI